MPKILVTGADGFIGSHLTEMLIENGFDVKAFVYYNSFNSFGWLDTLPIHSIKNLEVFAGDIRDPHGVSKALKDCNIVLHLAALIGIPYSYHSPSTYIDTNVKGTLNVLQAARDHNIDKVVVTSTSEVYGTAQYVPINENHPLQAQSPYAASKASADHLALSYFRSFDTPVTVIRPFNTYGPRQSARAVIPTIITQLLNGKTEIELGSLHPTRDFTFVKDTARGFISAINSNNSFGEVINLGSNFEISIGDLAYTVANLLKININIKSDSIRERPVKSEVERLFADASKANNLLNWEPKFGGLAGLKKGLEITIKWFSDSNNLSKYKHEQYNI
ncbi:MAG: NAD-dependent 4,6-dehydratase LegB [Desulfobacterales bacterium]|nr:NAD-dependent 4,6-dehydratase LegB [Desulfobacterales bacterium]